MRAAYRRGVVGAGPHRRTDLVDVVLAQRRRAVSGRGDGQRHRFPDHGLAPRPSPAQAGRRGAQGGEVLGEQGGRGACERASDVPGCEQVEVDPGAAGQGSEPDQWPRRLHPGQVSQPGGERAAHPRLQVRVLAQEPSGPGQPVTGRGRAHRQQRAVLRVPRQQLLRSVLGPCCQRERGHEVLTFRAAAYSVRAYRA